MRSFLLLLFSFLGTMPLAIAAETPSAAVGKLRTFLDAVPAGPGYAVVVVDRDHRLLEYVRGQRNAQTGAPLTIDTPMYIASQTKAYMGLLAHILERRGVLRLDSTLSEHWPGLTSPAGVDLGAWTLRDLLNHRVPIEAAEVTWLEAYVGSPDPALYPQMLGDFAKARDPGFRYDNLGYNIYAAILHKATGKRWQDLLRDELFVPLGLQHTSARSSDFADADLSSGHVWLGDAAGWETIAPKTDAIMQSAGGVFTSPRDMGRWLQLQLGAMAPGFDAPLLAAAHRSGVEVDPAASNAYELPCDGYAQGWNLCDFQGHRLYIHGGGYPGTRTTMAFAPELGVGIGVFSNSDSMTGWLTSRTVMQLLQFLVDDPEAGKWAETRIRQYPERVGRQLAARHKRIDESLADTVWGGWQWQPRASELPAYAGRYRAAKLPAIATVSVAAMGLHLLLGEQHRRLQPASPDLFGATSLAMDPPEPVRFVRDATGAVTGFGYDGVHYIRVAR